MVLKEFNRLLAQTLNMYIISPSPNLQYQVDCFKNYETMIEITIRFANIWLEFLFKVKLEHL